MSVQIIAIILVGLFILELSTLFFLSRSLTNAISALVYKLTGRHTFTVHFLAILFLPGTIVHELSHILVAGMMLVPVGEMEFMPQVHTDGVKLGSAQIGLTDPFRRAIIGLAPILVGTGLIISSLWLFSSFQNLWAQAIIVYMIFEIGNTMFSSKKDAEGLIALVATLVVLSGLIYLGLLFFKIQIPYQVIFQVIFTNQLANFLVRANFYLLIPLGIDLLFLSLVRLFHLK